MIMSMLFFFLILWLAWLQLNLWKSRPEGISNQSSLRSASVFMALMLGVLFFILFALDFNMEELPLAAGIGLGLGLSFLSPIAAFSFFLVVLILRPWEIIQNNVMVSSLPRIAGALVFVVIVTRFIREKSIKIFWSMECAFFILFLIWTFLTGLQSSDPKASQEIFFDTLGRAAILYFLVVNIVKSKEDVDMLRRVLVGSVMAICGIAIAYNFLVPSDDPSQRLSYIGLLGDPNDMSSFAVMALPFALRPFWARGFKDKNGIGMRKTDSTTLLDWFILLLYLVVAGTIMYLAQSRGAFLALAVFVGLYFMYRSKWSRKSILVACLSIAVVFPLYKIVSHREEGDMSESEVNRLIYWKTAINMAIRNPIMGVGFADFPNQYENYLSDYGSSEYGKRTAHSSWLLVLGENGFVGLAIFLALYLATVLRAVRISDRYPEFLFSILTYGVAMTFLSHSYLVLPYFLFSLTLISSEKLSSQSKISERRSSSS